MEIKHAEAKIDDVVSGYDVVVINQWNIVSWNQIWGKKVKFIYKFFMINKLFCSYIYSSKPYRGVWANWDMTTIQLYDNSV